MVGIAFENPKLMVVGSVATISGVIIGALWYKKYLKNQLPTKWMKVGEVEGLCVYPMKSFKGIQTSSFDCTALGPKLDGVNDRSFLVIDEDGKVVTGRDLPKMTQIKPSISGSVVLLSCPDFPEEIVLDINEIKGNKEEVLIWGTSAEGIDCGDEIASWLSRCILNKETGLRMLFFGIKDVGKKVNSRITAYSEISDVQLQNDGGSFSDGVSYHVISEASVKELNSRLDKEVTAYNFRPNVVIKGDMLIPFEEDSWNWVKIGEVVFRCLAPCTRCLFTTIDPNTGEKSEKMEPLASLRRYRHVRDPEIRKILQSPAMGIYLGLRCEGTISVGDEVFIPQI